MNTNSTLTDNDSKLSKPPKHSNPPERVQARASVAPLVDVYENKDELLLVADVPGATPEGISIQFDKGQLTIEAKREGGPEGTPLGLEHRPADYYRAFSVPQGIDAAKIEAQLTAGVLRLRLPKTESVKPRRIEVKAS
jgi:HSP20 family molecular chaperone IbpA